MSAPGHPQGKSVKKYVLQQSNCNLDHEEPKQLDKTLYPLKVNEEVSPETENQCTPHKIPERSLKSDSKRLRSVRLDLSSHKRGVIQKGPTRGQDPEEESSGDEELKTKRKPPSRPVVPNYVTNSDSGPCRKPRHARQDQLLLSSQSSPRSCPQSLSIARRNARERNRVKQVNEGFATLRSRIPDYISEAYNEEKGRKSAKKLSKVETLRMAVDYIRHLETLLDLKSAEKDVWLKEVKMEEQSWDATADSGESPGGTYDQGFEYQDRIFYDYDMEFVPRKKTAGFVGGTEAEGECVEDFKYYETFNRIRKEGGEKMGAEEEEEEEEEEDVENVEVLPRDSLPRNVILKKVAKKSTVLPSITESFNKSIPVFF